MGEWRSAALRERMLRLVPAALDLLGAGGGTVLAIWHYHHPKGMLATWFSGSGGWELDGFAAFGSMSGFALASLALVASMAGHERAHEVIDSNAGRYLLRTLISSTWAWLLAALACLLALGVGTGWSRSLVVMLTVAACGKALIALTALYLFFKRFTVPKPSR